MLLEHAVLEVMICSATLYGFYWLCNAIANVDFCRYGIAYFIIDSSRSLDQLRNTLSQPWINLWVQREGIHNMQVLNKPDGIDTLCVSTPSMYPSFGKESLLNFRPLLPWRLHPRSTQFVSLLFTMEHWLLSNLALILTTFLFKKESPSETKRLNYSLGI